jgi:hypothetical protein
LWIIEVATASDVGPQGAQRSRRDKAVAFFMLCLPSVLCGKFLARMRGYTIG